MPVANDAPLNGVAVVTHEGADEAGEAGEACGEVKVGAPSSG
jgi:hypothetical protein